MIDRDGWPEMRLEQKEPGSRSAPVNQADLAGFVKRRLSVAGDREVAFRALLEGYPPLAPDLFLSLAQGADENDPIFRQIAPLLEELETTPLDSEDPIGDRRCAVVTGRAPVLVHRYPDRALILVTSRCALNCRFCFRRSLRGRAAWNINDRELSQVVDYLRQNPRIQEVILTGGDPLTLTNSELSAVLAALKNCLQVRTIRIHSRIPVVAPDRLDEELLGLFDSAGVPVWLAAHFNHAREITPATETIVRRLLTAGVPTLSQTVLLRGVNDSVEALERLFRGLIEARVKPYYLHHCDQAYGNAHFRLPLTDGRRLMRALRGRVSGHALPLYVLDIPGGAGKVPVERASASPSEGGWQVEAPDGEIFSY